MVSGAVASIIVGASPIVSAIIAHLVCQDDKLNNAKIVFMCTAALGVILVVLGTKPWSVGGISEVWGICLLITGSVVSSLANIIVSNDKKSINPVFLNSGQIFLGGCMLFLISIPLEGLPDWVALPIGFYFILGWLSFISAAAFSIWFYLLQHDNIKVSELNFWKFLIPVFGASLSWLFLADESPNTLTFSGMALVTFAVWKFNR
jgi:drug/metabolite transporter (DMT)-like permease